MKVYLPAGQQPHEKIKMKWFICKHIQVAAKCRIKKY